MKVYGYCPPITNSENQGAPLFLFRTFQEAVEYELSCNPWKDENSIKIWIRGWEIQETPKKTN